MTESVDVAIVGAGPYGLSLAAHLRHRGVPFRIFGSPMRFWRDMPEGIALKSFDFATNVYAPIPHHSFVEYCRTRGISSSQPVDMAVFTEYGLWVQKRLVPEVEDTEVIRISRSGGAFQIELASAERISATRIVIASGLRHFERIPAILDGLPRGLVSHTSWHRDYSLLRGKEVTVLGAGQSAIEAAALLHRHGAAVRLVARAADVWFSDEMPKRRSLKQRISYPQTVLGPGRVNWVLQHFPALVHYAPEARRVRFTRRHLGPFGTHWLRDQVVGLFPIDLRTTLRGAHEVGDRIELVLVGPEGERRVQVDHVVAGTGYEVAVDRIPFLDSAVAAAILRVQGSPRLDRHFQSSLRGLYFVGPAAALSFGPLMRFVCGAAYAAPAVAAHLRHGRRLATAIGISPARG